MRASQRGSILGFVVVGGIMALLLVGGAYAIRYTLAGSNETAQPATREETKDDEPAEQPADDTKDKPAGDETTLPGGTDSDFQPQPKAETPADLPQTGPVDAWLTGLLLGVIIAAALSYKRSRDSISSL